MKRIIAVLTGVMLLFFTAPAFAAANQYVLRRSDTISQEELGALLADGTKARNDYQKALSDNSLDPNRTIEPQPITIYGWFDPEDTNSVNSEGAVLTGSETRATLGTANTGKELETLKLFSNNKNLVLKYSSRLDGSDWSKDSYGLYDLSESTGNTDSTSVKMNNFKLSLDGPASADYTVYYRVYLTENGWLSWAKDGEPAVSDDKEGHIESLDIRIVPRDSAAPPEMVDISQVPVLTSKFYMQVTGWEDPKIGKNITIGDYAKKHALEAFSVSSDSDKLKINYSASITEKGWTQEVSDGAMVGSPKEDLAIEAVKFSLTGEDAPKFDIYYRTYVKYFGWLDWTSNGKPAGTQYNNLRVEGVELVILPKGAALPGDCRLSYISAQNRQEGELIRSINVLRAMNGLPLLSGDAKLHEAAARRSGEITQNYSHIRPDNKSYDTVLNSVGYRNDKMLPPLGESLIMLNGIEPAYNKYVKDIRTLELMQTDYYKYVAFNSVESPNNPNLRFGVLLLTNEPSSAELQK